MNPWDNDPVDQPLRVEINGTAADEPTEPWNADPVDAGPDVRAGTLPAVDSDPDKVAQARALSQVTGIPASVIEEDPAPAERRVKLQKLDEAAAADPAVAKVLADPETAKLAHDDVENLSLVGETVRSFGRFFGAIGAAVPQVNAGLWGVIRAGADIVGADSVAGYAADRAGEQSGFVEDLRPKTGNWVQDAAYSGVTSFAQSLMFAPAGMAGLLSSFGLTSGGEAYSQARDAGKGVGESLAFGASQGVIEAGTEMLPAKYFLDLMKGGAGKGLLGTVKQFAASEGIGEQVATLLQDLNEWAVLNPEKSLREFAAERPGRAAETLIATVVSVGASTTAAQAVQAYSERAQAAQQAAQQAEQLLKASEASQLRARDPEAFRNFLRDASTDEAGDESTFFIDGRAFAQAIGSTGVSFEEFRAKAPELAQQMIEAVQTGGDVEIPVADFATAFAGTQEGATLLQHVRTSADAASAAEAAVFAQTQPEVLQQELEKALTAAQGEEVARSSETTVRERILQQLQSTGRYNEEVAGINAQVAASMFTALGAKMGRTAEQVMADFPLRIVGENPAAPGEVLQATDGPQFRAWFGESKVVDGSGAPLVVYHGTASDFEAFDPAKVGSRFGFDEIGFFFTSDPSSIPGGAGHYAETASDDGGGNVMPVYLSLRNPYTLEQYAKDIGATPDNLVMYGGEQRAVIDVFDENREEIMRLAREGGYDGLAFRFGGDDVYAAFRPEQIKSVFNRGTWDANDPNILNQRAPSSRVKNPTSAVRKLLKRLTPQEAAKITDATAAKIVDQLTKLPSADEMAAVAFAGAAKRGWYKNSSEALISVFGFDAPRFAVLLAAMSPQTSVENNLFNTLQTWKNWVAAGRPTDRAAIVEVMGRSVQGDKGVDSVLDAWINNSVRALTAENPADAETTRIMLSGPKVNSFFLNLIGVMDEVTNDAWMANYALVDQTIFAGSMNAKGTDPGKGTGYLAMSARVREAAARLTDLTGEEWTPAEVQETIWSWAKTLYELQTAEGETRGARQIVLDGGLTDDLINATPDFSSLFRVEPYASILKDAGYEQQLQDLAVADAAGQSEQEPGTGGQAAPFAEGDQRRLTLRAAQRLERLARERGVARQFTVDIGDRTAADVGGVVLNVGLADPAGGPPLTEEQVTKAIEGFGVRVVRSKRYQSNTEPTLVARLSRELTPAEAHELSEALGQEAVVQMVGHRGALHGPKKENWGEFNPDFFITLDGKPASQIAGATFAQSVPTPTVGYHYSNGPRTLLDGRHYGTVGAGEERARVARSDDPRIKSRVYAYIDWGNGIRPEDVVGGFAHEIALPPLYDFDADPLRLRAAGDANATESAILDAGFGGYFVREFGAGQGAAVILGEASQGIPARPATPKVAVAGATREVPTKYRTPLMSSEIKVIDMADVQAAAPSAKLSAGTFSVDVGDLSAAREVLSKFGVALPETSLEQPVYHGTPHEFEAFSFDHIGTGEGAQVFGWGLYFAESRGTANYYREILQGGPLGTLVEQAARRVLTENDSPDWAAYNVATRTAFVEAARRAAGKGADAVREAVIGASQRMAQSEFDGLRRDAAAVRALADNRALMEEIDRSARGQLYKLDIPDEALDRMLLWDAPLSEQPVAVREALAPVVEAMAEWNHNGITYPSRLKLTGEGFYGALERQFKSQTPGISDTEAARQASEYLASIGVPGNRYLDGLSRGRGEGGTYNVVVWDQALLDQMNEQLEKEVAQRQEAPRGTFNPSTLTISLLEKADLSTFLHELGHFGLEMMVEIAAQPGAPQTVIDDVRIILDWFGVKDIQTWRAMTLEQQRPYHEKFAEGFETYLFEGKSPSADLNTAFARVAAWMLNVYKSLTSMRVKLTPEVRGVFDRMLATNDQIAEQSRLRSMAPMFESAEQAGMSAKDWAAYQEVGAQAARDAVADLRSRTLRDMRWLSNAKGRALKKLQDSAKEARRGVRAEVEAQVDAQPVYAAMAFIEHGALAERDLTNAQRKALDTVAGGKTKLSLPALKDLYGTDPAAPWRYIKQTMVAAEDGAHPDAVAEAFGFDSGDALVRAILAAEPRQQLIEALTDKRMLEEHADLSDPAQIELAAEAAIHNEARIRFVATEMKALQDGMSAREKVGETKVGKGKQAGQVRAITVDGLVRAASQYAEAIVGRTVVRRLNPTKHARAAANEAKAAAEAMKKGDLQEALAHKRNQLLHERTSRMMSEAITEFEKNLGYLRKFRRSNRARGAISSDYIEQIENLLNAVDTRQASNKRLESLASLRKWIAAQEAEGLPVALDPELIESLQIANVRDLTVEQLRALVDQVRSIEHLGKLKKKLLTARDKREFDAIADELAASIREHGGKPRDVPFAPGAAEHTGRRLWDGFFAEHRKLASLAREMDGVVDDGPMWRALIRSMNDAGNRETARIADSTKVLGAIFKPLTKLKGGLTGDKRLIPSLGQSLSRGERMAVLLNWGNEHGRQRVLNTVPAPAVAEIMQTMSREEALAIQAVWDHVNEYWPDIAAKEKRVTGTVPEKVDAVPFTIALVDGTTIDLRGGYYPIVYESEMSDVAAAHEQAQIAKEMQAGAYTRATTRRGHTKKRAEKVGEPLRFTLDVIERHISQVVHDLAWHEWLIDAGRLLRDKRISSAIRDHYGPATLKAMKDALSDIATGDLQRMSRVEALVATGRARVSAAMMGWSATTALLQPFGLFQSIPRVGAIWIARGMKHWAGDTLRLENSARIIREKSAMMRHRSTTFNRDIREVTNRIHRGKGVVSEVFDASLFVAMQKMQLIADIPTWWGAYEKAMAESTDEGRAVALADQAVLDAQGGGQVKDLAGVQRGNELKRALSMFYSYFSATWNLAAESTARTNFRKPAQVAGWLADMVVLSVVPVLAQQIVFALVRGGDDDEDKDWAERAMELSKALGSFWLNTLIGVREFSGMVQGFEYNGPAATRALVEAGNLGKTVKKAVDPDEELDDADYRRATKSVLTLLGWPAAQVDRSWRGWQAYEDGEAGPGGVILGPPPKD